MKIILFLIFVFNTHAAETYRARDLFSNKEVRELVSKFYELHDKRENATEFQKILAEENLYMLMGSEVRSKAEFKKWLKKTRLLSKKVTHKIIDLDISSLEDGSYFVESCINYKGLLRFGIKFDRTDRITWKIIESKNQDQLLIKEYIVYKGCK